jgi:hypothetical protein
MGLFSWIKSIFTPVDSILKTIDVSGNDRKKLENAFAQMQADVYAGAIDIEKSKMEAYTKLVAAESQSPHWIAANWRPIASLSLVMLSTYLCYMLGDIEAIIDLTKIIVGGHVGGRSLEKVAAALKLGK